MSRPFRKSAIVSARRSSAAAPEVGDADDPEAVRRPRLSHTPLPPEVEGCCGLLDRWRTVRRQLSTEQAAYLMINRRYQLSMRCAVRRQHFCAAWLVKPQRLPLSNECSLCCCVLPQSGPILRLASILWISDSNHKHCECQAAQLRALELHSCAWFQRWLCRSPPHPSQVAEDQFNTSSRFTTVYFGTQLLQLIWVDFAFHWVGESPGLAEHKHDVHVIT